MSAVVHATAAERIAHYAQLWREAEKAAIGNRRDKQLQWVEHQARRKLREVVDVATRGICAPS